MSITRNGRSAQAPLMAPVTVGTLEHRQALSEETKQLICRTQMQPKKRSGPVTVDELELFSRRIESTGLDPFARQIYVEYRNNRRSGGEDMSIITTIDGLRTTAEGTGRYGGRTAPLWCGSDGVWLECWAAAVKPVAAKVGVYKQGGPAPTYGVAHMSEYDDNRSGGMYERMPRNQLAVRAEANALRAAFPGVLSGLYVTEEVSVAEEPLAPVAPVAQLAAVPEQAPTPAEAEKPAQATTEPPATGGGGSMIAVAVEGSAAPAQMRQKLRARLEAAALSGEAASKLAGFLFDESRSDRLSADQIGELTEVIEAIGAGGIAEGTLKGQLTKAASQPERAEARAVVMRWILGRANKAAAERDDGAVAA